jgi:glutaredoxin
MDLLFGDNCTTIGAALCPMDEIGTLFQSICPVSCGTCNVAVVDNDAASTLILGYSCQNVSDLFDFCKIGNPDPFGRFLETICPVTCDSWAKMYLQGDRCFKNLTVWSQDMIRGINSFGKCDLSDSPDAKTRLSRGARLLAKHSFVQIPSDLEIKPQELIPTDEAPRPTFVMFQAPWCDQCHKAVAMWKSVSGISLISDADLSFKLFNAERNRLEANALNITQVPTIVYFPAGMKMEVSPDRVYNGEMTIPAIRAWVDAFAAPEEAK